MFVTHTMFGVCDYDEGCKFDYYRSDDCLSLDFLFLFVDCNTTIPGLFDKSRWILDQFQYSSLASQLHSLDFLSSLFLAHQWPVFC